MKKSKESVDYSLGHQMGDHCGICQHFQSPHDCEVVAGVINSKYWCKLFKKAKRSGIRALKDRR